MSAGVVVWITGLPSAGKSKLARGAREELTRVGVPVCVLDGDDVRSAFGGAFGYAADQRAAFYETLAKLAALLASQGLVVLVPATAHRRSFRDRARGLHPTFVEVWVDTPLDESARRDSKGLYAAAQRGEVADVPGLDAPYEPPVAPDVVAHGGADAAAIARVVEHVARLRAVTR